MLSNLSEPNNKASLKYPSLGQNLTFSDYIARCRALIEDRRTDLHQAGINAKHVLDANSPFELTPENPIRSGKRYKYGALLIHGLFDCPFSLRDTARQLQANGVFCRAVLLPGHGTTPSDLLDVNYQEWIEAVRYGVNSLRDEVEQLFLVGYSMGGALSIHHALENNNIDGLVLLAPAIKVKAPVDIVVSWHKLLSLITDNKQWIYSEDEIDYAKYQSIAFNPVAQIATLIEKTEKLSNEKPLNCPIYMVMSHEDETVSSHVAVDYFMQLKNPQSKLLLYSAQEHTYPDSRITTRLTQFPNLHIKHFSHVSAMFREDNSHYGIHGDYAHASKTNRPEFTYGAYNHIEVSIYDLLYNLGIITKRRRELTYNPDFPFMANEISQFILTCLTTSPSGTTA